MTRTMLKYGTIFGLLASSTLLTGCTVDATGAGGSVEPTLAASPAPPATIELAKPVESSIDLAAAKTSWRDGVTLFERGDYQGAVSKLKIAADRKPQDAYRRYLLGLALWKSGDPGSAEASLVESASIDPSRVKTWINLARVRNGLGDRNGAIEASDKAIGLDATSANALHQKGRALIELNRSDEALTVLTSARGFDPGNGYVANTLGLLLIQLGKPGEAIEPLELAKSILPHIAYVRNNLGVAYERTGKLDDAKIEYLAAVDAGDAGGKAMKSLVRLGATDTTGDASADVATVSAERP